MVSAATAIEGGLLARRWIINRREDMVWFIGSVLASYALLFANVKLGVPAMILTWVWALGFDGPHVFGTVSRTYADRQERRERTKLLHGSLALFLIGPAMVLAGRARLLGTAVWGPAFFFFASLWAYYHLVKQHYGFMVLYKKKNGDLAQADNLIDRAFLMASMTYPFVHFIGHSAASAERVPFPTDSSAFIYLERGALLAFLVSLLAFVWRQIWRVYLRLSINLPKLLLLAAAVPMHWIALKWLEPSPEGPLAAVATLTIYHNLQYHRIVWFHNKNKYVGSEVDYGLASRINKSVWHYAGFALAFGAAYHIPHYTVIEPDGLAMGFFWGGAFIHYYLDSKIWRVRRDAELNRNLRMA